MIAITLMVGCFKADNDDAAALHIWQHKLVMSGNRNLVFSNNKITTINTNLLKDAKLMKTSAVGCAAQAASILKNVPKRSWEVNQFVLDKFYT